MIGGDRRLMDRSQYSIGRFLQFAISQENLMIVLNIKSLSSIADKSFFFITRTVLIFAMSERDCWLCDREWPFCRLRIPNFTPLANPHSRIFFQNELFQLFTGQGFVKENSVVWWTVGRRLDRVKRIWYLSPMRATKVQASLRIRAVSPEPPLLAHTSSESRGTFKQKARSLAHLNGWACAVKMCHDGMLEDTNSLDGAQTALLLSQSTQLHPIL